MRALLYKDAKLTFLADHPIPARKSGEALVRVTLAGICNTDIEIAKGYMEFEGVLGHEFVGVVEEADTAELIGKRVVGEINCACGACETCANGLSRHCPHRTVLGIHGRDGAFADYLALPQANLHAVPDDLADEEAVFVEPLAAAFEILEQVSVSSSDRVAVLGDGKLGLLAAQVVAGAGCDPLLLGKHVSKLRIVYERGGRTAFLKCNTKQDLDIVVDCTGAAAGFNLACDLARPRGTVVLKSTVAGDAQLNLAQVVIDELTIVGSRCGPFRPALEALRKKEVAVKPLITAQYPFAEALEAFERAAVPGTLKILLDMT
ncbi:MAG: alcohol dehydrogenase catalytic domain-containing protein [Planctomycetes bacterium]|nr:alcohol dehydrogenase catalytic domain-containing protein [Planctomycetota bacterium]